MFFQKVFLKSLKKRLYKTLVFLKFYQKNVYGVYSTFKAVVIQISFFYIKPVLLAYVLQSLQGQFLGFHFLILFLKESKLGKSL